MPRNRAYGAAVSRRKACGQEFSRRWLNWNVVERGGNWDRDFVVPRQAKPQVRSAELGLLSQRLVRAVVKAATKEPNYRLQRFRHRAMEGLV